MAGVYIAHRTVLSLTFPSFTILALDSQVINELDGSIISYRYDKLIQLRPCVFLACFGNFDLIEQIRFALLSDLLSDLPENPRFVGDLALYVQNTINKVLGNARDRGVGVGVGVNTVEFVLIGRCDLDSRCYVFNISKGPNNTWMCFGKRQVGRVATATDEPVDIINGPIATVTTFILGNVLNDENIEEEEAVKYALRCMKYAEMICDDSGGRIQVVVVKPGSSIVHAWEQDDPSHCMSEYIYRGHRISEGY